MFKGIIGKKIGMTQVFTENGQAVPVTAVEVGPCIVVQKKTQASDGYNAVQLGFGARKERRTNRPLRGHFARANVKPLYYLREFVVDNADDFTVGQEIKADVFLPGEKVDLTGISKGKGFAGGIKRHGFHRGPTKHGSKYHRRSGSLGAKGPAKVFKGRKMPGRAGGERVTAKNLEVVHVDAGNNLLLVKGAVPGPRNGLILVRGVAAGK